MRQEHQYVSSHDSLQRRPRTRSAGQRVFWSVFWSSGWWLLFGLIFFIAMMGDIQWHIPFFLSLLILLGGYIALMVVAIRQWRFQRSNSQPRSRQRESREGQADMPEVASSNSVDPQPFSQDHEQFQVPYPGQE